MPDDTPLASLEAITMEHARYTYQSPAELRLDAAWSLAQRLLMLGGLLVHIAQTIRHLPGRLQGHPAMLDVLLAAVNEIYACADAGHLVATQPAALLEANRPEIEAAWATVLEASRSRWEGDTP